MNDVTGEEKDVKARASKAPVQTSKTGYTRYDRRGPVSLNMMLKQLDRPTDTSDVLGQIEQQVKAIEINYSENQQKEANNVRYREHEDLITTVNEEPDGYPTKSLLCSNASYLLETTFCL